jgi:UDP-glucose 4-epimerase
VKIVVTGGEGFIGSNLVPSLLNEGHQILVISQSKKNSLSPNVNLKVIEGNYGDERILDECLPQSDMVIHLAYSTVPENSMKDPVFDIKSNLVPVLGLLRKMSEFKVKKLVFVSSGGVVYGNPKMTPIPEETLLKPVSSYGISKAMIEKNIRLLADKFKIDYSIFRIANAYGSGQHNRKNQGVINIWLNQIQNGKPITVIGDGEIIRDYIHVNDIVNAFQLMIDKNVNGVFNIGTAIGTSLNELIRMMENLTGKKAIIQRQQDRKYDVQSNVLAIEKFQNLTGWKPLIEIQKGLEMQIKS